MFYVYEWYLVDTNEVFYVGKGTRNRYKVRKHNKLFNDTIANNKCDSRIVKEFESEQDAFAYEFTRINELKAIGQCSCNIRVGGFGGKTDWWTDEIRERYSQHNVMKSENQRKRMSEQNPMKNKEIVKKVVAKKSRGVVIGDKEYRSVKEAQERYGVCYDTIASWCSKGINYLGEKCRFTGEEQVEFTDLRYNKGCSEKVVYKGVEYEAQKDLAKAIGVAETTICKWLKKGFDANGNPCRRVGDTKEYQFVDWRKSKRSKPPKPIIINGKKYNSCADASEKLGIPKTTIYSYLDGRVKNGKMTCVYAN